jgi:hypothetical protein
VLRTIDNWRIFGVDTTENYLNAHIIEEARLTNDFRLKTIGEYFWS